MYGFPPSGFLTFPLFWAAPPSGSRPCSHGNPTEAEKSCVSCRFRCVFRCTCHYQCFFYTRHSADPIQAFFLHFFFVWRPPHPLHPHLLCTRKSEARTDSPGAFVCWSTAPNPKNHAVRRMTADTIGRIIARWPHPARKRHRRKKTGRQAEQGTDNSGTEIHFRFPAEPVHGLALVRNCSLRLENP